MKLRMVIFLIIAFVVSGCSNQPDVLFVKRTDPLNQSKSGFKKTVTDKKVVYEIYNGILNLPPFPKGPTSCPADNGVEYLLTFKHGTKTVSTGSADALGCRGVMLDNKVYWTLGPNGFRELFENALDLSESEFAVGFAAH